MTIRIPGRIRSAATAVALLGLTTAAAGPFALLTVKSFTLLVERGTDQLAPALVFGLIGLPFIGWCQRFLWCFFLAPQQAAKELGARVITPRMVKRGKFVTPEESTLYAMVKAVAERAGLRAAPKVAIVPSDEINAFAVGRRGSYLIAVNAGTINRLSTAELAAVIGHEVGHVAHGDTVIKTLALAVHDSIATFLIAPLAFAHGVLSASNALLMLVTAGFLYAVWEGNYDLAVPCGVALLLPQVARLVLLTSRALIAQLDRWREYHADAVGAALTSSQTMATALSKIAGDGPGKRIVTNPLHAPALSGFGIKDTILFAGLAGKLFATHPPIQDRVSALISGRYR
ncbi:heat shock protein HtpX [Azospirillum sp. OGB3]|uniref:M48 family metallopeptidase n=1 Tax=Azospirillum sp. OGB3 TaxID=2587012 RepID=UPI0016065049|nr:M48 family metalloprotease [Azospirillum sp. OGB3]MBB3268311.1 heat shock protein HtpX [Azospirillum sp. OGB3]